MVSSVSTGAWDSCVGLAPLASGALPPQIQALTRVQVEVPSCLYGHGAARRGLRSLCCDTGCSVSVLGRVGFGLLVALEAWPKGLDHCPCQVTASYVPPHSTCPSVTCSLVPLWEWAAALICVYSWRVLGLPLALGVVPPSGVSRSLARPRSQLASCVMF